MRDCCILAYVKFITRPTGRAVKTIIGNSPAPAFYENQPMPGLFTPGHFSGLFSPVPVPARGPTGEKCDISGGKYPQFYPTFYPTFEQITPHTGMDCIKQGQTGKV